MNKKSIALKPWKRGHWQLRDQIPSPINNQLYNQVRNQISRQVDNQLVHLQYQLHSDMEKLKR